MLLDLHMPAENLPKPRLQLTSAALQCLNASKRFQAYFKPFANVVNWHRKNC